MGNRRRDLADAVAHPYRIRPKVVPRPTQQDVDRYPDSLWVEIAFALCGDPRDRETVLR